MEADIEVDPSVCESDRYQVCNRVQFLAHAAITLFPGLAKRLQIRISAETVPRILTSPEIDHAFESSIWSLLQDLLAAAIPDPTLRTPVCLYVEYSRIKKFGETSSSQNIHESESFEYCSNPRGLSIDHMIARINSEWRNSHTKNNYVLFWILKDYIIPADAGNVSSLCNEWLIVVQQLVSAYLSGETNLSVSLAKLLPGPISADELSAKADHFCRCPVIPRFEVVFSHETHKFRSFLRARIKMCPCSSARAPPGCLITIVAYFTLGKPRVITTPITEGQTSTILCEFTPHNKTPRPKKSKAKLDTFLYATVTPFEFVPMIITKLVSNTDDVIYQLRSPDIPAWRKIELLIASDVSHPNVLAALSKVQYILCWPMLFHIRNREGGIQPNAPMKRLWIALCMTYFSRDVMTYDERARCFMFALAQEVNETHFLYKYLRKTLEIERAAFVASL